MKILSKCAARFGESSRSYVKAADANPFKKVLTEAKRPL
jgi:hypothetical protein